MTPMVIPSGYNYIGVFLTFSCNLKCSYCINDFEPRMNNGIKRGIISGADWVRGLNRIVSRDDLPVTFQGGEPSLHPDFIYIINNLKPRLKIDILTNLQFDIERFIGAVKPERINRDAPYASLRVSYHPGQTDFDILIAKVVRLSEAGFKVGIWALAHPGYEEAVLRAQEKIRKAGIDFRLKEFLGEYNGRLYGTYKYAGACEKKFKKNARCKTTELLMDSRGNVFRCHADVYSGMNPLGSILDAGFRIEDRYRDCAIFGYCNPCDVKIKTDRFQQYGHTSVDIQY